MHALKCQLSLHAGSYIHIYIKSSFNKVIEIVVHVFGRNYLSIESPNFLCINCHRGWCSLPQCGFPCTLHTSLICNYTHTHVHTHIHMRACVHTHTHSLTHAHIAWCKHNIEHNSLHQWRYSMASSMLYRNFFSPNNHRDNPWSLAIWHMHSCFSWNWNIKFKWYLMLINAHST